MSHAFAYYDREADIAWLPTGRSSEVVSEETEWGLIDLDAMSKQVVAVEIWAASTRLPSEVLAKFAGADRYRRRCGLTRRLSPSSH